MKKKYLAGLALGGLVIGGALAGCAPAPYDMQSDDTYAQQSVKVQNDWNTDCSFDRFGWILDFREDSGWRQITQIQEADLDGDGDHDLIIADERGFITLCENRIFQKDSLDDYLSD